MIDRKLIIANAPERLGEQVHVNHTGCPAGLDIRQRLYIKRDTKGLVAYCHNCNQKGFAFSTDHRLSSWLKSTTTPPPKYEKMPIQGELSLPGKEWLSKYNCTWNTKNFRGLVSSPYRVALVLLNPAGEEIGIQVRTLQPEGVKENRNLRQRTPKYITYFYNQDHKSEGAWFMRGAYHLVITEDYLSAYRINSDTGYSSVALLRTSLTDTILQQIHKLNFKHISIWLDPDAAGIEGAVKVHQKLRYYLPQTTLIETLKISREPKQHSKEELNGLLDNPFV